jgi:hypothetical protein
MEERRDDDRLALAALLGEECRLQHVFGHRDALAEVRFAATAREDIAKKRDDMFRIQRYLSRRLHRLRSPCISSTASFESKPSLSA